MKKAFILAGGKGERLRPITAEIPKPMLYIGKKPLLQYYIEDLRDIGIEEIWFGTSWLAHQIENYFRDGSAYGVKIRYSVEDEPMGTAGAMRHPTSGVFETFSTSNEPFLIVYGDNFTNFKFKDFIDYHNAKQGFMTIGLYRSAEPWTCGIVDLTDTGEVKRMVEKPPKEECFTDLVNAAIYMCDSRIYDFIPEEFPSDFGYHVIPKIIESEHNVYGWTANHFVQDVGTLERLQKARDLYDIHYSSKVEVKNN